MCGSSANTSRPARLDDAALQRCDQRGLVDDRPARDVDERAFLPERGEHVGVDDVLGRRTTGTRDDQEVGRRREPLEVGDVLERHLLRLAPGVGDLHSHRREALRDRLADAAEAQDAGGPARELRRELGAALLPIPCLHKAIRAHEPAARHQHESDGDVGDVVGEDVGRVRHLDAARAAIVDRHAVIADAEHRYDLERRQRVEQRRRRDGAAALNQAADDARRTRRGTPPCRPPAHSRGSGNRPSRGRRGTAATAR